MPTGQMGLALFTTPQRRFDGGLFLRVSDVDIGITQLQKAQNCRIDGEAILSAPGFLPIIRNTPLPGPVKFLFGDQVSNNFAFLAAADDGIFQIDPLTLGYTTLVSGLNVAAMVDMDRYAGRVFIVNGVDANRKFDGTSISLQGIVGPSTTATAVGANAGGTLGDAALNAIYQIHVTFYDATHNVESNPDLVPSSTTFVAGVVTGQITLNNFPVTTNTDVTHYRIYMTDKNGALFTRQIQIPYNPLAVQVMTTWDATGVALSFDNDAPDVFLFVRYFKDRLYGVTYTNATDQLPADIRYSKSFLPENFPQENFLRIGDVIDERIVCIERFYDMLVIGTNRSIWVLDGDPTDGGQLHRVTGFVGMLNHRSHALAPNQFIFMGSDFRIYSLDPTQFAKTDVRPTYLSAPIEPLLKYMNTEVATIWACGFLHHYDRRDEAYFSVPLQSALFPSQVFVYDLIHQCWLVDDKRATAFGVIYDSTDAPYLAHGDEYGWVWENDQSYGYGASINGTVTAATTTTVTAAGQVIVNSTATGGTLTTLTDATQTWVVNRFVGQQVYLASGTGVGQFQTILSNTATTLTVGGFAPAPDNTTGYQIGGYAIGALKGVAITITAGTGVEQQRVIVGNPATQVTIDAAFPFTVVPGVGATFSIGTIDFNVWTGWDPHTVVAEHTKRGHFIHINTVQQGSYTLLYQYAFDMRYQIVTSANLNLSGSGAIWGGALWGLSYWGSASSFDIDIGFGDGMEYYRRMQHRFRKFAAGQPVKVNYVAVSGQDKALLL